ncbi:MAG: hypothetical protein BGN87_23710 [Rhizobiales bacterium 65-79]|jgi:uncharacterized membrane protein YhaH (DUF805 family)|nr:DUF805 domain-containing protein [Hyphomicrobiales bacterium]OJU01450.1 MAG: hypothetical protein BGN87_23710 [Rhizobiales bacterium 65-79]
MRGDILHFDGVQALGVIIGDDGSRYAFSRSDLYERFPPAKAIRVEFRAEGGRARDIARARVAARSTSTEKSAETRRPGLWRHFLDALTRNYANFRGRARRAEYWSYAFFWLMALALVMAVGFVFDGGLTNFHAAIEAPAITLTLSIVFVLATLLPGLGLAVRRQHDIGLSGWYSLFVLIPSLGSLILLAFSLIPSQKRDNRWGPVPENVIS